MRKVRFEEILNAICEELGLTPNFSRPFNYQTFKQVMLATDMIVTERTIKTRWEQLLAREDIISSRGKETSGNITIALDVNAVRAFIASKGVKPWSMVRESERETHTASEESQ